MYDALKEHRVFINKSLDPQYPLMANAIFENEEMQMIVMLWGLSWERMTLGQANMLVVVSALIQNAVLSARRYLQALEEKRYIEGSRILDQEAFSSLVTAYYHAKERNLVECVLLHLQLPGEYLQNPGRQSKLSCEKFGLSGDIGWRPVYSLNKHRSHRSRFCQEKITGT